MLIPLLLHITLAVEPAPAMSTRLARAAVAEAAGVWAPYGVAVDACAPLASSGGARWREAGDAPAVLAVQIIDKGRSVVAPGWRGPLAAIVFAGGGEPAPAITVFMSDIEQFVAAAHVLGLAPSQWPSSLREELLARVLGRVLAHEIGHYVLRSPRHAARGLMRSQQVPDDLVAPSRRRFALTAADAARLDGQR
jgi:hypothetical protein